MTCEQKMERVIALAGEALSRGEAPIAAVIYHGDNVVAAQYTTEHTERRFVVHAELNAIVQADKLRLPVETRREPELYTNLEPCMMCLGAAMSCFIGSVSYALEAPNGGAAAFAAERFQGRSCVGIPSYTPPRITSARGANPPGIEKPCGNELRKSIFRSLAKAGGSSPL